MRQLYGMNALNKTHKHLKNQIEAAGISTRLTRSVSLENLYKECGWLTLSQRRQQHKLSFMYNVNISILPSYIKYLIPPLSSKIYL